MPTEPERLPPEAFENDFFPGWEVSKRSYSPKARARFKKFIASAIIQEA